MGCLNVRWINSSVAFAVDKCWCPDLTLELVWLDPAIWKDSLLLIIAGYPAIWDKCSSIVRCCKSRSLESGLVIRWHCPSGRYYSTGIVFVPGPKSRVIVPTVMGADGRKYCGVWTTINWAGNSGYYHILELQKPKKHSLMEIERLVMGNFHTGSNMCMHNIPVITAKWYVDNIVYSLQNSDRNCLLNPLRHCVQVRQPKLSRLFFRSTYTHIFSLYTYFCVSNTTIWRLYTVSHLSLFLSNFHELGTLRKSCCFDENISEPDVLLS